MGMRGVQVSQETPPRLLSVISTFRNLDATDPRDKIFAFLNLAEDKCAIVPDYTPWVSKKSSERQRRR